MMTFKMNGKGERQKTVNRTFNIKKCNLNKAATLRKQREREGFTLCRYKQTGGIN